MTKHVNCQATWQKEHNNKRKHYTASREQYSGALESGDSSWNLLNCIDCFTWRDALMAEGSSSQARVLPLNNPGCLQMEDVIAAFTRSSSDRLQMTAGSRPHCSTPIPEMLPCLRRVLRPVLSLRAGTGFTTAGLSNHQTSAIASRFASQPPLSMLVQRCNLGTHPEPVEPLNSPRGAKEFIYSLHPSERTCLLRELHRFESIAIAQGQLEVAPPTAAQLRYVLLHNALPFVGFGFLDNCIMIVAGTQIELSIGVILGISTMAGYVEALASRLGMQIPDLSPKQADMWQTRVSSHSGKAIGVGIGCILGMFPLLFFTDDDEKKKGQKEAQEKTQPPPSPTESSKN
ncbi:Transmembrane protein 65 [Collichthys lucidus]|uniref:Transmembrane protein 65 n=1 Tax=Collichthys lucidus TaxID=240159 RepID=A0A4U5V2L6_COLLU|nr:Transmembrane protein 65 [Collichthys lucidus]